MKYTFSHTIIYTLVPMRWYITDVFNSLCMYIPYNLVRGCIVTFNFLVKFHLSLFIFLSVSMKPVT